MQLENHLKFATITINLFYNQFGIGKYKLGLYPLFGLIPGMGDFISILLAVYLIWIAQQMQLPATKRAQMYGNILIDLLFGAIPLAGDLVDTVFRAHVKNLKILRDYANEHIINGEVVHPRLASL